MAKLRHIAIAVPDLAAAVSFYEDVFEMKRVRQTGDYSVLLTDGVVVLAVLDNKKYPPAAGRQGLHHMGFVVDDLAATRDRIESRGGTYIDDDARLEARRKRQAEPAAQDQRKFRDPDGIDIDVADKGYARLSWCLRDET